MKRKIPALLPLVLLTALSASAQTPAGWVKFTPPTPHFNVLLPSQPKEDVKTSEDSHGPYTTYLYMAATPEREIYMVGWVDYDPKFNFACRPSLRPTATTSSRTSRRGSSRRRR